MLAICLLLKQTNRSVLFDYKQTILYSQVMADTKAKRARPARIRILEAADQLLYGEGIHTVGIERILDEAGVVKASLYSNFESKDELIAEYLRGRSMRWQTYIAEGLAKESNPEQKILRIFDLLGKWLQEPGYRGCPFTNAVAEYPDPKHPVQTIVREHRQWLRKTFRSLSKASKIRNADALTSSLMFLYDGVLIAALFDRRSDVVKGARRAAEELIASAKQA